LIFLPRLFLPLRQKNRGQKHGRTAVKIKLLTSRVLASGQTQQWGDEIELPEDEAKRLIKVGQAQPVEEKGRPEKK
jgi:hypothetical protein